MKLRIAVAWIAVIVFMVFTVIKANAQELEWKQAKNGLWYIDNGNEGSSWYYKKTWNGYQKHSPRRHVSQTDRIKDKLLQIAKQRQDQKEVLELAEQLGIDPQSFQHQFSSQSYSPYFNYHQGLTAYGSGQGVQQIATPGYLDQALVLNQMMRLSDTVAENTERVHLSTIKAGSEAITQDNTRRLMATQHRATMEYFSRLEIKGVNPLNLVNKPNNEKAISILKKNCVECHNADGEFPRMDKDNFTPLEKALIVVETSTNQMPKDKPPLSDEDVTILYNWSKGDQE